MYPIQSTHRKKSTIFAAKVPEIKNIHGGGSVLGGEANFEINTVLAVGSTISRWQIDSFIYEPNLVLYYCKFLVHLLRLAWSVNWPILKLLKLTLLEGISGRESSFCIEWYFRSPKIGHGSAMSCHEPTEEARGLSSYCLTTNFIPLTTLGAFTHCFYSPEKYVVSSMFCIFALFFNFSHSSIFVTLL